MLAQQRNRTDGTYRTGGWGRVIRPIGPIGPIGPVGIEAPAPRCTHGSMDSTTSGRRRSLPKIISGLILLLGVVALKAKGLFILAFEKVRILFVNPFEGFGAMQYAIAGGSFVVTIAAYATQFPLAIVVGFVVITLIHEIGHAVAIRAKGLRTGFMVFIPFIGGAVTLKDQPTSAYDDALIGLAGPFAGTLASLAVLQYYKWSLDPTYLFIALLGFALNLFNLLPIGMLDGGRISAAVTKWMWVIGGGAVVYKIIDQPSPLKIGRASCRGIE